MERAVPAKAGTTCMYLWRSLTQAQRDEVLAERRACRRPWHSPPRSCRDEQTVFHLAVACFEHQPLIGASIARMDEFTRSLQATLEAASKRVFAWCVLPNHYHLLVETINLRETTRLIGQTHGRTSFAWNREDAARGRTCFHGISDRRMRNDRHFWATMNYIHNNPVHHGLVVTWTDWPWSSAHEFLAEVGREEAVRIWREYPVLDYGKKWDVAGSTAFRRKEPSEAD
jgi:putative transposase